jgi:hypothetical protein
MYLLVGETRTRRPIHYLSTEYEGISRELSVLLSTSALFRSSSFLGRLRLPGSIRIRSLLFRRQRIGSLGLLFSSTTSTATSSTTGSIYSLASLSPFLFLDAVYQLLFLFGNRALATPFLSLITRVLLRRHITRRLKQQDATALQPDDRYAPQISDNVQERFILTRNNKLLFTLFPRRFRCYQTQQILSGSTQLVPDGLVYARGTILPRRNVRQDILTVPCRPLMCLFQYCLVISIRISVIF